MTKKTIRTDDDHREALKIIERLMALEPEPDSPEGQRLTLLAEMVQVYEAEKY